MTKAVFISGKLPSNKKERITYLYRMLGMLTEQHNQKGKDFRDGKISEKEFRKYQDGWHARCSDLLCDKICEVRTSIQEDKQIAASLSDIKETEE